MTQHPQQEYRATDEDFDFIWKNIDCPLTVRDRINVIKSRKTPAPASPFPEDTEVEVSCGSLEQIEKPCDHCDFQEREDYIHSLETQAATIRNELVSAILTRITEAQYDNSTMQDFINYVESLRSTQSTRAQQHERGDQR